MAHSTWWEVPTLHNFRWVRDHGNALSTAYMIALAELERMEKPEAKLPRKGN